MRAAYTGQEALTFGQFIDTGTGKTLHAEPGGVYDILPASGHVVPEIPAAWFVPVGEDGRPAPGLWPVDGEDESGPETGPETAEG